jgi:hypothetical protein
VARGPAGVRGTEAEIRGPRRPLDVYGPAGLTAMTTHLLAAYTEDIAVRTGKGGELEGVAPPVVQSHEIRPGVGHVRKGFVGVADLAQLGWQR